MGRYLAQLAAIAVAVGLSVPARAGEATVAVAANFLATAETLSAAFSGATGHELTLAHGSTGRLYAQIVAGAPFDVFLSADAARPARLAAEGRADAPLTYALGRLVLVVPPGFGTELAGRRVALADPEVAPYGAAAMQALSAMGADTGTFTLLLADSVAQAASIFATGNADGAFIAAALLPDLPRMADAVPMEGRHDPIRQDAVILARGRGNPAAQAFFAFLASTEGRSIIADAGYGVPE